jgi:hypothetical protein
MVDVTIPYADVAVTNHTGYWSAAVAPGVLPGLPGGFMFAGGTGTAPADVVVPASNGWQLNTDGTATPDEKLEMYLFSSAFGYTLPLNQLGTLRIKCKSSYGARMYMNVYFTDPGNPDPDPYFLDTANFHSETSPSMGPVLQHRFVLPGGTAVDAGQWHIVNGTAGTEVDYTFDFIAKFNAESLLGINPAWHISAITIGSFTDHQTDGNIVVSEVQSTATISNLQLKVTLQGQATSAADPYISTLLM